MQLFLILEQYGIDTAVLCGHLDDLAVIVRNAQTLRQHLTDRAAAAAILTRNGDDRFFP